MSFDGLRIGASGLYAAQRAADLASQNIANAGTTGYTRQRLELVNANPTPGVPGLRGDGMRGTGVSIAGITRLRDSLQDLAYRSQAADLGYASARAVMFSRAEDVLGSLGEGLGKDLDELYSAFSQLSLNPTDPGTRQAVLNAANTFATNARSLDANLNQIQSDALPQVRSQVSAVNDLLSHVALLNKGILDAVVSNQTPSDLMDERDRALDQLSNLAGIRVRDAGNGVVDVYLGGEAVVRGERAQSLTTTLPPTALGVLLPDGNPAVIGGQIGGYISASTVDIPQFKAQLDAVVAGLINSVNTQHQAGTDISNGLSANGAPGLALFNGNSASTIFLNSAVGISNIAASASGAPADGNNAVLLANLRSAIAVGSATVTEALHAFNSQVGQANLTAKSQATASQTLVDATDGKRVESNSVNIDEEMVDLVKFQHAYEAAARVVSTCDAMLDTLINQLGR